MQSLSIDRKLSNLPLAITMGEPGGINSEIFLKAINEINKIDHFIICDPSWIEKSLKFFNKKMRCESSYSMEYVTKSCS